MVMIVLVLDGARRSVGMPLVLVSLFFFIYSVAAQHFPGILNAPQMEFFTFVDRVFMGTHGIYGIAIYVMGAYVIMFIFFGAFLLEAGGGNFFIKLAYALAGRRVGGPAKAAVVASAFLATISGSIIANIVTTGSFTIPLMKKAGFKSRVAGAIEAVASTGGQLAPPVMGAASFIMAFFLNRPYLEVCLFSAIPAFLYFFSVYYMIHLEASRQGLKPVPQADMPKLKKVLAEGWHFLLPVAIIIAFLVAGYSPSLVGLAAIASVFLVSFRRRETRFTWLKIIRAMENGVRVSVMISVSCAAVGIIIAAVGQTGFGARITNLIVEVSGGYLIFIFVLTMIISIILGMGLTTIVLYISLAATVVPAMIEAGVPPSAAHLCVLYYGVISFIVPPVALGAFAAAGLAGSNPMHTGVTAMKFGVAGLLVPFLFVFQPALVLEGSWYLIPPAVLGALGALVCLASSLQGWFLGKISWPYRVVLFGLFLFLTVPQYWSTIAGLSLLLAAGLWRRRENATFA